MLVDGNRDEATFSEEEKLAVHEQLERLLANPYFSHSRRFPSFLRFVVERTLSGQEEALKERTLGIEISADRQTTTRRPIQSSGARQRRSASGLHSTIRSRDTRMSCGSRWRPDRTCRSFTFPQHTRRTIPNMALWRKWQRRSRRTKRPYIRQSGAGSCW